MPTVDTLLASAAAIANQWRPLALAWHLALICGAAFVFYGWRPTKRVAAMLIATPLVSVSALAWFAGNPFNGAVFATIAATLFAIAVRLPSRMVSLPPGRVVAAGGVFAVFGLVYPHFLNVRSPFEYFYESPFGLLPCPTLLVVAGVSIMTGAFESHAWRRVVSVAALVYGAIGMFVFGVMIDVALIAAGVVLWVAGTRRQVSNVLRPHAAAAALMLAAVGVSHAQAPTEPTPEVSTFLAATRDYAALHRRLEAAVGRIDVDSSVESINRSTEALAAAIRSERHDARQGDLFTPALAHELRARVDGALRENNFHPGQIHANEATEGIDPATVRLHVNDRFPWALASMMFPCVIAALPPLPPELQYRIVGDALLLIDVHAGVIVDVLPNVLADMTARKFPAAAENPALPSR